MATILGNESNTDKVQAIISLDQFLDEAYFVLELIGVNVFTKTSSKRSNVKTVLPPIPNSSPNEIELRAKAEVKAFLLEKKVELNKFYSYAKLQEKKKLFWINPDKRLLKEDWMIVLNNQVDRVLHILKVPANTFDCSLNHKTNTLRIRPDKPVYIDLNIHCEKFIDVGSKLSFKEYLVSSIKY